ncbi:MAG: RNase H-like domain-containing protein, partial [Acidobacteria bacterium]|nr:RNase H-like domain-containing protein [Acidobacteriota bacterium]
MGDAADDILKSFHLTEEELKTYATVKEKFDNHFIKKHNVIYERARFNQRCQEDGETFDDFVTALYGLVEHCQYGNLQGEMIRDRVVVGLRNRKLSERLQLEADLTLEKAITMARQSESVRKQQPVIRGDRSEIAMESPVNVVNKQASFRSGVKSSKGKRNQIEISQHKFCTRCGKSPIHDYKDCPAKDAICHKCSRRGHFKRCCRSTANVREIRQESSEDSSDDTTETFIGVVEGRQESPDWTVTIMLNDYSVDFSIDTGADVTVVPEHIYQQAASSVTLQATSRKLCGPSHHTLSVVGKFLAKLKKGKRETEETVYVVRSLRRPLLGRPAIESLRLVKRVNTVVSMTSSDIKHRFSKLFTGLGRLQGNYHICLKPGAKPYSLTTPRRVAIPLLPQVKKELTRMEQLGVIEKVEEPTDWCAGLVVVPKQNGKVRICVDLTKLNENVCRERHPLPAIEQILAQLSGAAVFSILDANSGFWQIPLSDESARLTTFISPYGRFCFRRLPFGITSAPEHFQRRMSCILSGLNGVVCLMDDILVHGETQAQHDDRLVKVLHRLQESGLTLNSEKCKFSQTRVRFLGHVIEAKGIHPDPDKIKAITQVKTPQTIKDIRRFLGMLNQMIKFVPNLAETTKPLRDLLSTKNQWAWGQVQEEAFNKAKTILSSAPVLALFDPNLNTVVSSDASSFGLGAVLLQTQRDGSRRPVAYISRAMTSTEQRYAQIEKEALALTWACERFSDYLIGMVFHCETDHKPLIPLLSTKNLDELPPRVQRFRMRLMRYRFTISHVPGKSLVIADTLSRAPLSDMTLADHDFNAEVEAYVNTVRQTLPASEKQLMNIHHQQERDEICQQIVTYCNTSWPNQTELPAPIRPYLSVASELTVVHGLLMRGTRIVIPVSMHMEILEKLHEGHQGITKTRERAKQSVWWPGLSSQIEEMVKNCPTCCKSQSQRAQPLIPSTLPSLPWQKVAMDIFEWKKASYLLLVDYYSRYIEIAKLSRPTSGEVIMHTKSIFARHGIPETVISDNGPQFSSKEFSQFADKYCFVHVTSSPYFPQSNGEAERAVQTIKQLLKKAEDPYVALLAYRNTPLHLGYSPAQLLMCRRLRTSVPTIRSLREPEIPDKFTVSQ